MALSNAQRQKRARERRAETMGALRQTIALQSSRIVRLEKQLGDLTRAHERLRTKLPPVLEEL